MKIFTFLKARLLERSTRTAIAVLATAFGGPVVGLQVEQALHIAVGIAGLSAVVPDNKA